MELWTRIEGGRLSIARKEDKIIIPGFLLATTTGARATPDVTGQLVTSVENGTAKIENIGFPAGIWDVHLETDEHSHLSLSTLPDTPGVSVMNPITLHIVSRGEPRSFNVSGTGGLVYALIATREDRTVSPPK